MPPPTGQVQPGYVQLNSVAFRLHGPMRPVLLTTPPPRFTIGRDIQGSEQILNVVTFGGPTGGIGIHKLQSPEEINTSWSSELRPFRWGRALPEFTTAMGTVAGQRVNPGTILFGFPSATVDAVYETLQTVATGKYRIRNWAGTQINAQDFDEPRCVLSYRYPTDNLHYLFISDVLAGGVDTLFRSTADDLTGAFTNLGVTARALAEFDNKLVRLDANYECFYSTDNGATWASKGKLPLTESQAGGANSRVHMVVHTNTEGTDQLYAVTSRGLYFLDWSVGRWGETKLMFSGLVNQGVPPSVLFPQVLGLASCVWRGDLYLTAGGMEVLKYTVGETALVSRVGPNANDGLPTEYAGHIVRMVGGFNELYALFVRKYGSGGVVHVMWGVMAYNGAAWRVVYQNDLLESATDHAADPETSRGSLAAVGGFLYFCAFVTTSATVWYIRRSDVPATMYNPRVIPLGASLSDLADHYEITPWIDAFNDGRKKLAVSAFIKTSNLVSGASTRTARLWWGSDENETTWNGFFNLNTGAAVTYLTTDAIHELAFDTSRLGLAFDSLRLRLALRSSTGNLSPIVPYFGFYFLIIPRQRFGYTFTIEIEDSIGSRATAQLQRAFLETLLPKAAQDPQLILLRYHSPEIDSENTIYGFITRLIGDEQSGHNYSGRYTISFVAVIP